jgi:S1-C subfamily serine protease
MQRRFVFLNCLVWVFALTMPIQAQTVKVSLHIVLVDRELNQKPVPWFHVTLRREDPQDSEAFDLKTGLDGTCERAVQPGRYELTTPQPIELQGRRYTWSTEVRFSGTQETIELTNDNATVESVSTISTGSGDPANNASGGGTDLGFLFERLKKSEVTVRAEAFEGSGFIVDASGLVVTNNHVVESSRYLAVQFDQKHKVVARLLAANPSKDIAVLWVNLRAFPEAVIATLVPSAAASQIVVGERVFTIGSPMGREKVLTSGVISKVENASIFSDININPGSSGGPLFNLRGEVTGITSAQLHLLASIIPIADARPVIEQARHEISGAPPPSAELLPVEPEDFFPADALLSFLQHHQKMDVRPYFFSAGQFDVEMLTPPLRYYLYNKDEMEAALKAAKRARDDESEAKLPSRVLEDAQEYQPTIIIRVVPQYGFWKRRYKNSFRRMRLLCGGKEVPPIDPGRSDYGRRDLANRIRDTTMEGFYSYQPDAISPNCSGVTLEIFSEKNPSTPVTQLVDSATVERIWVDMEPYRRAQRQR